MCHIADQYEMLFMHTSDMDAGFAYFMEDLPDGAPVISGIAMSIGCSQQSSESQLQFDGGSTSTVGGDIVRNFIRDDAGTWASFDWQMGCAGSGDYLSDTWIHYVLSVSPGSINVLVDGVQQSTFGYPNGRAVPTGEWASRLKNPAYPNPSKLNREMTSISFSGNAMLGNFPAARGAWAQGPGAFSPDIGFVGRMAYVQVFPSALSENDAACLFSHEVIEGCDATHNSASGNLVQAWPLTEAADDVELKGNAAYHSNFGLRFDGKGDRAIITPATDYTASGSFTIVFWATQSSCKLPSTWEVLFGQGQDLWQSGSSIAVMMQCWGSTPQLSAWVKTGAPGETGPSAGLQPLATPDVLRSGGDISANWIAFGLSVTKTSMAMFIDGMLIPLNENTFGQWGWAGTPYNPDDPGGSNLANPTPMSFPADLDLNGALAGAPIELGGQSYGGFFEGSIIALSVYNEAFDMHVHDCVYQQMEATVATCATGSELGSQFNWGGAFTASFLDGETPDTMCGMDDSREDCSTWMMGDAHVNGQWGLTLDGDGDYLKIKGSAMDFSSDATFGVSFWFTKCVHCRCAVPPPVCRAKLLTSRLRAGRRAISPGAGSFSSRRSKTRTSRSCSPATAVSTCSSAAANGSRSARLRAISSARSSPMTTETALCSTSRCACAHSRELLHWYQARL